MAIYQEVHRCPKCGESFTWYYQPESEGESAGRIPTGDSAEVEGIMLVTEQIYEVLVTCPHCGEQNDFNCKIEQELPGLRQRLSSEQ